MTNLVTKKSGSLSQYHLSNWNVLLLFFILLEHEVNDASSSRHRAETIIMNKHRHISYNCNDLIH